MSERLLFPRLRQTVWLGPIALAATTCIADVNVPVCVYDHDCGAGGEGLSVGRAGEGGEGGEGGAGGESGQSPWQGGTSAGAEGSEPNLLGGNQGDSGRAGAQSCPGCSIEPRHPLEPCQGRPFKVSLKMSGGVPPYQWQLTPQPPGWSLAIEPTASDVGILRAEAVGAEDHTVTVTVTDVEGRQQTKTLPFKARTTCWFAHTAVGETGAELFLLDPLAEEPERVKLAHNVGVVDFAFSPDGRFLAYRFGPGQSKRLALVELATLEEQLLNFNEDEVLQLAWSPDSTMLAAAFRANNKTYLGAARLPAPGSEDSPVELTPTLAFVESELSWVGTRFVVYHAAMIVPDAENLEDVFVGDDNPLGFRTAFFAELLPSGFSAQHATVGTFDPDLSIQTTSDGFYAITAGPPFTHFTALPEDTTPHWSISLIAPSGAYTAVLEESSLAFQAATDGFVSAPAATSKAGETCPQLLAWSTGTERVACVADVNTSGTQGELRFFTLAANSSELELQTLPLPAQVGYGTAAAQETARSFSPSGRFFAFTRVTAEQTYLLWTDVSAQNLVLNGGIGIEHEVEPPITRLAFSADERFLALQRGSRLAVQSLTTSEIVVLDKGLPVGERCTEEFPNAPAKHCAYTDRVAALRWAADSRALIHRVTDRLVVTHLSTFPTFFTSELPALPCAAGECSEQLAFQPTVSP